MAFVPAAVCPSGARANVKLSAKGIRRFFFPRVLAFLWLCVAGGQTWAQVNLLPQGDFKNPGANTGWAEGFNIPENQEFQVISENGKSWLRIENHDAERQLDYVHAYVRVAPEIESLTISVRLKATNLKVGKEGWHDARVAMSFEGGSFGYPSQVPELAADSDWVTKSVELKVPKGATRLNIQPAMFRCTGVFEIADLTVTPHLAGDDAVGRRRAAGRHQPELGQDEHRNGECKAGAGVLGRHLALHPRSRRNRGDPPRWGGPISRCRAVGRRSAGRSSDFVALGGGPQWDLYDGARVARAWYERQVPIPAEWQGRAISLRFDRVCTDAIVYVNGTECGRIAWPWGSVDITSAVTPGQTADVRVLVAAIADAEQVGTFWQNAFSERLLSPRPRSGHGA